ncbi:histone acetyltransferase HAC1-like [Tripterygium wilfordii]|uniref:histone acetyltransferase n=2 Tax=Tripterygium wilfordii TaxID=458696 RepID=A0A7J7D9V5_TRIWF|nr:histone acetyltransferase HAC1-like [Tripterygium wilfordii]
MSSASGFSLDDIIADVSALDLSLNDITNNSKNSGFGPARHVPNRGANRASPYRAPKVDISDVPTDTKDKDDILESEFLVTKLASLSLCQGNNYQHDIFQRAKHLLSCKACHLDIEWRCKVCPECNAYYQQDHKLTKDPSNTMAELDTQNKESRQIRVVQIGILLHLIVHVSQCRTLQCQDPNCRKVRWLYRHLVQCRTTASRGCVLCKKMWSLLLVHAATCKESECHVPRCR